MRSKLLNKLANAIRAYRGVTAGNRKDGSTIWKTAPQRNKLQIILGLLVQLELEDEHGVKLQYRDILDKIDGFKTFDEFNAWFKEISA